jgi:ion channel
MYAILQIAMNTTAQPGARTRGSRAEGKFFYLFLAQVLLLVLFPYLNRPGLPVGVFRVLGGIMFLAAVYAVSEKRAHWITAVVLAVPTTVMNVIYALDPDSGLAIPSLVSAILFLGFTLVVLLKAVFRAEAVTRDTIYGAVSVYLLLALVWGVGYVLLDRLQPGALSLDPVRHGNHQLDWADCIFYSFVTLATVGYGDIVPVSPQARSLSILEAVCGVMYVAVLMARLVGGYAAANAARLVTSRESDSGDHAAPRTDPALSRDPGNQTLQR